MPATLSTARVRSNPAAEQMESGAAACAETPPDERRHTSVRVVRCNRVGDVRLA